jgi:PAS domain-containing protein
MLIAAALLTAVLVVTVFVVFSRAKEEQFQVASAHVLSSWLESQNREALALGRPELAELENVLQYSDVKRVIIFDGDGSVFVPISMRGDNFVDHQLFKKILSSRSLQIVDGNKVFKPVLPLNSGGQVYGLVYVELHQMSGSMWIYAVIIASIIIVAFVLFGWWVFKDTMLSVQRAGYGNSGGFKSVREVVDRALTRESQGLLAEFEREWRSFIHLVNDPVIILDNSYRLRDANSSLLAMLNSSGKILEGSHVLDIVGDEQLKNRLIDVLDKASKSGCDSVFSKNDDMTISVFSSASEMSNFKYTIVCAQR